MGKKKEIKDEEIFIDNDPHISKFFELSNEKGSQYELEALEILNKKTLTKNFGNYVARYSIKGLRGRYELVCSKDSNKLISGVSGPIGFRKKDRIFKIKYLLAHSEATAFIESQK